MGAPILMPSPAAQAEPELDCAAFELVLSEVLDRDQLPPAGRRHLQSCQACSSLLASFEDIAARVRHLAPSESEPSADLWPQIASRLREEGIIHADLDSCRAALGASPRLVSRGEKVTPAHR